MPRTLMVLTKEQINDACYHLTNGGLGVAARKLNISSSTLSRMMYEDTPVGKQLHTARWGAPKKNKKWAAKRKFVKRNNDRGCSFSIHTLPKKCPITKMKLDYVNTMLPQSACVKEGKVVARKAKYPEGLGRLHIGDKRRRYISRLLIQIRCRCAANNIEYDKRLETMELPEYCPVFGFKLEYKQGRRFQDNTVSFDRFDPSKGYVLSNVRLISMKANRLKSNASFHDIRKLYRWMKVEIDMKKPRS